MNRPEKERKLGLYLHIPFCHAKCLYCDFYSLPSAEGEMDRYTATLRLHLEELAPRCATHLVDTVYLGGGTPSYLGYKRLKALLKTVRKHYHVDPKAEITLEANPDSCQDWRHLRSLRRAGFNRISLGVQSANDDELKAIGRLHNFSQVAAAVAAIRRAKIKNLSLDLIYGLPGQTMESWQSSVAKAVALAPQHLSCYGLKLEEGTPLWKNRESLTFPDDDMQADMYLWCVEYLGKNGYEQYEISNFAKPGFESRHNMKYWTLQEYAGFGPGAHSDLGDVRYAYVRDLDGYCKGVAGEGNFLSESERIPPRERDLEYLMLGLRTAHGIAKTEFENRYRLPFQPLEQTLQKFAATGHAQQVGERWRLTPTGFLISNQIIGAVLEALGDVKTRREQAAAARDYRMRPEEGYLP
jgi:oxygen-independent coproporphyrinogen-3 oxidase